MNILSTLPKIVDSPNKRRGRGLGSRKGAKSGRGTTRHQTARTDMPLHFEGGQNRMVKRFPLLRGKGRNKPVNSKILILTLDKLNTLKGKSVVDADMLVSKGIITKDEKLNNIKVVGEGTIETVLTVRLPVTKSAQSAIEKAGGKVE